MRGFFKGHRLKLAGVFILSLISYSLLSGMVFFEQRLIDGLINEGEETFWYHALQTFSYALLSVSMLIFSERMSARFIARTTGRLRQNAFFGVLNMTLQNYYKEGSADYLSTLTNDILTVKRHYFEMFLMAFTSFVSIVTAAVLMLLYQPVVAAAAIFSALLMLVIPLLMGKRMAGLEKKRSDGFAGFMAGVKDLMEGFETIFTFGIFSRARKRFEQINACATQADERLDCFSAYSNGVAQMVSALSGTIILGLSCFMVARGRMSIGSLTVFMTLQGTFVSSLSMVFQVLPVLRGTKPILQKVMKLADTAASQTGNKEPAFQKKLTVSALTFAYPERPLVLDGVSFALRKGEKYALVGGNGGGKTTLVRLLCGEFPTYGGSICYDGCEMRTLKTNAMCRIVSAVHQNVFLFNDSLLFNITLGEEFSGEQLHQAVVQSGVASFLDTLEHGIHELVGENGQKLSGGQRQRVAIARALIRGTPFLIFDEGTSAVDEASTREIEEQLLAIKPLTLLFVTHDQSPSHLEKFDGVLRMENGGLRRAGAEPLHPSSQCLA